MFPTRTIRPPSTSGSTFEDSSTFRPVCSWMRFPMSSTRPSSSSTALVTVTGSSWFSSAQSASNSRRMRNSADAMAPQQEELMRNSAGMRWRSASSSRKFTKRSSASLTIFRTPSRFSSEEKYGENRNTWSVAVLVERLGELAQLVVDAVEHVVLLRDLEQRAGVDLGDLLHALVAVPFRRRRRQLGEVDLRQRLLDEAAVVLRVERLAGDLLGGGDRQVRDLPAELVERAAGLVLDVAARLASISSRCFEASAFVSSLSVLGRLARPRDDVLGLLARLTQPRAVLLEQLVGLLLGPLADSIDSSIAMRRRSSASAIRGKASLLSR